MLSEKAWMKVEAFKICLNDAKDLMKGEEFDGIVFSDPPEDEGNVFEGSVRVLGFCNGTPVLKANDDKYFLLDHCYGRKDRILYILGEVQKYFCKDIAKKHAELCCTEAHGTYTVLARKLEIATLEKIITAGCS